MDKVVRQIKEKNDVFNDRPNADQLEHRLLVPIVKLQAKSLAQELTLFHLSHKNKKNRKNKNPCQNISEGSEIRGVGVWWEFL